MPPFITTARLAGGEVPRAYPLARSLFPGLGRAAWVRRARRFTDPAVADERGILTARNVAGYLCGFCFYTVKHGTAGALLAVDRFIAFDATPQAPVAAALLDGVERLAGELGCVAVRSSLGGEVGAAEAFRRAGFAPERTVLSKRLHPVAPSLKTPTV